MVIGETSTQHVSSHRTLQIGRCGIPIIHVVPESTVKAGGAECFIILKEERECAGGVMVDVDGDVFF